MSSIEYMRIQCIDMSSCVSGVYDCNDNSPCNAANRLLGKYYFAYIDMSRYIQCGILDRLCWVRQCPKGTTFRVSWSTCA